MREQRQASFVCLWAIDRSQARLLEIYIAVELPVSAVALTKPLPIVFDRQLFRRVWNLYEDECITLQICLFALQC